MKTISVNLGEQSYPINIDTGWKALGKVLDRYKNKKALVVTDNHIFPIYYEEIKKILLSLGIDPIVAVITAGEESKILKSAEGLYTAALNHGLDRSSVVVSLGGGVIGDLAGFVASTYMRGLSFIQIPTSLLAQVDSSIGGKTGINHPSGKNIIGTFYQPELVYINVGTLGTLPSRELSTGLAELIKHGIIFDEELLSWLEVNMPLLMLRDSEAFQSAIYRSCKIKAYVVEQDEKERNLRKILNFGHTAGHAIEALTGYKQYTHGEAVSLGMIIEAAIAYLLGIIDKNYFLRIKQLLSSAGLPVSAPALDKEQLIELMRHDKKNTDGKIVFVLPTGPGLVEVFDSISNEIIANALDCVYE